jgi:carbon monoxide dehydrogenase subunit G
MTSIGLVLRCEYASLLIQWPPSFWGVRALLGEDRSIRRQATPEATLMAMTMNGEVQLAAPREMVWTKLNDPEVLKACIPGCEELEKTEDNGFRAVAKMKVGPVSARFKGRVTLSDLDPPNGYKISGEGEGGVAGFAKGGATVGLTDSDGGTLLKYDVEAQIGGKLAQLGQRLINGSAKKLADEFFANFAKAVQG